MTSLVGLRRQGRSPDEAEYPFAPFTLTSRLPTECSFAPLSGEILWETGDTAHLCLFQGLTVCRIHFPQYFPWWKLFGILHTIVHPIGHTARGRPSPSQKLNEDSRHESQELRLYKKLEFNSQGSVERCLKYVMNTVSGTAEMEVTTLDFMIPQTERALILVPIELPTIARPLFSSIEEAINIGREIPNCEVWVLDSKGVGEGLPGTHLLFAPFS